MNRDINKKMIFEIVKNTKTVQGKITEAALYEQMAEECTELAQACLKKARKIRGENFTPLTDEKIDANINEEFADISLCAISLGIKKDYKMMLRKSRRWIKRNNKEESNNEIG